MGPDLRKFRKKCLNQPSFEGEKSLDMGKGFQTSGRTPRQKIIRVPPPGLSSAVSAVQVFVCLIEVFKFNMLFAQIIKVICSVDICGEGGA